MGNPSLPHNTQKQDAKGIYLEVAGIIINDKVLMKAQESTITDAAGATASALTVTGVTLDTSNLTDGSANNTMLALNTTWAEEEAMENQDKICDEIEANRIDLIDAKTEFAKLLTDVASIRTQFNALLQQLEDHGILADA